MESYRCTEISRCECGTSCSWKERGWLSDASWINKKTTGILKIRLVFFAFSQWHIARLTSWNYLLSVFPPGKWFGQGRTWWSSGGGHQARPYRCPGSPTYPHQSRGGCRTKRHQLAAGRVCGRCVHANRHHLWTYYGTGQASACYPTSPWHLSLPAVWQVRASIYVKVNEWNVTQDGDPSSKCF